MSLATAFSITIAPTRLLTLYLLGSHYSPIQLFTNTQPRSTPPVPSFLHSSAPSRASAQTHPTYPSLPSTPASSHYTSQSVHQSIIASPPNSTLMPLCPHFPCSRSLLHRLSASFLQHFIASLPHSSFYRGDQSYIKGITDQYPKMPLTMALF